MELMDQPAVTPTKERATTRARILHVLAPAPFGGLERVVESLATEQARAGDELHVAAVLDQGVTDHPLLRTLPYRGVHAHALEVPARAYRYERGLVRELCTRIAPDVVHTHGYRTDVLHTPVARELGIPTVSTSHGFIGGGLKNRMFEHLQRRAFRQCDAVVAVSRPMASMLLASGVPKPRLHVVPNAWTASVKFLSRDEARAQLGIPDDEPCVGFIGRVSHEKGPDVFLDAMTRLRDSARAVIIGEGRMRGELTERARSLGLQDVVRWTGALDGAGRLMKAFDVLVLSSRTEGTPVVLLEAMAAGVPVVATRVGGIPGVISNREAILVQPEDPAALAEAIDSVLTHSESAAWRVARAFERLRSNFSADRWLSRYAQVYRSAGVRTMSAHARASE